MIKQFIVCCAALISAHGAAMQSQVKLVQGASKANFNVLNVSEEEGYSNQPLVTSQGVFYTQEIAHKNASQMDVLFYDLQSAKRNNVTNTVDVSEYSPTLIPSESALSLVVVEQDNGQKLWRYPLDNSAQPARIFYSPITVGYHAWGKDFDLILFALGEPHSAQYLKMPDDPHPQQVVNNPGRAFIYLPSVAQFGLTFEQNGHHQFATYNPENAQLTAHFTLPEQVQDFTLKEGTTVMYAHNNRIYTHHVLFEGVSELDKDKAKASMWLDLSEHCQGNITRLSYHLETDALAFVCEG